MQVIDIDVRYEELFAAIWREAVHTDTDEAEAEICDYAFEKAYEEYAINADNPHKKNSAEIKNMKQRIKRYSNYRVKKDLTKTIRTMIYNEAQEWPALNRNKRASFRDTKTFKRLKKDALRYALKLNWPGERMGRVSK